VPFYDYVQVPFVVELTSNDKAKAIRQLARELCKKLGIRGQKQIVDKILQREEAASTFIGQGIALPHTSSAVDEEFSIIVGRSKAGINYDAARGALVHLIVLIISSNKTEDAAKVELLSELASFFKTDAVREQILNSDEPIDLRTIIKSFTPSVRESRAAKKSKNPIIDTAVSLVKEVKAAKLFVFADTVRENDFLDEIRMKSKLVVVCSTKSRFDADDKRINAIINAPTIPASRIGQMKIGILLGLSRNIIKQDDKVICLSGNSGNGVFDTVICLDIAAEYEFFFNDTRNMLPSDINVEVLERVLGLANEIANEGREGKSIGTIFVVGDTNSVNKFIRQLIINPFRGYSESERSILDPGLDETIKEFAAIDGAFIITGDGVVLSAGSYLRPQAIEIEALPSGFGARHAAAAGISSCTNALAITVSESTGMVSLFKNGTILMTLSKPAIKEKSLVSNVQAIV